MHMVDPTVAHCLGSMVPISWDSSTFNGTRQHEFYEQACGFGLTSGISLPIHGSAGEFGMLSLVSSDREHLEFETDFQAMATLSLIRDFTVASIEKFAANLSKKHSEVKLTRRELECIKWVMVGKSSWEISMILNCSEATVNFHIANMKKKFDVNTRQQAVVKAIKDGFIIPS
jgi:LuxR family quorum-sensing transcriptional regulator LasR